MATMKDLVDSYKNLLIGGTYEISVPNPPYDTIEQRHITQVFKDFNIHYVKILEHRPAVSLSGRIVDQYVYKVATYDDKLKEVPIRRRDYENNLKPPNEFITPKSRIRIIRQVRLAPSQKIVLGEAELQKQRSAQTKQILESSGLSGRSDAGPLTNILEYAGIKPEVRPRIKGGKTKKSRRKTRKHR